MRAEWRECSFMMRGSSLRSRAHWRTGAPAHRRPPCTLIDRLESQQQKTLTLSTYVVQLVVKAARIADGLAALVAAPQRRRGRLAVGARGARSPGRTLQRL